MTIPTTVKHDDLMAAMKPLLDLLGTSSENLYLDPPLVIGVDPDKESPYLGRITFAVPAGVPDEGGRLEGVQVTGHPQGGEFAEWMHFVTVEVV